MNKQENGSMTSVGVKKRIVFFNDAGWERVKAAAAASRRKISEWIRLCCERQLERDARKAKR